MAYQTLLPPSSTKPVFQYDAIPKLQALLEMLRFGLNISTWLALGATLQACLILLPVSLYYSLAPGVAYLLFRIVLTGLITYNLLPNPYLKGVIPHRFTAIVPDKDGNFPAEHESPTKEKIAVFLLIARANHPGGWVGSPLAEEFGKLFDRMNDNLRELPQEESGFLGHANAYLPTPDGTTELINISYWRSKDHIIKYADSPLHRDAMKWWKDNGGYDEKGSKVAHLGIGHEIYESEPGKWSSLYLRYQPTLLAATSYKKLDSKAEGGSVPEEWISPVIDARRGKLAGVRGRMATSSSAKESVTH